MAEFTVDDTSPTISYSPFADTFSTPNLNAGWNPYYTSSGFAPALGVVGNGTSLHITSFNGASLALQWHGTGIQLWGNATSASYSITLDGAPFTPAAPPINDSSVLAIIDGLTDAPHSLALTAQIPAVQNPPNSSMIVFQKAVITSSPPTANVSFQSQTINDNDIAFLGRWSFETDPSGASFHTSQTRGDRVVTFFNGTTFLLKGTTSPLSGNYTVSVDNVTTSLSGRSSFTVYDSLLFYASGLDSTAVHSVEITNNGGGNLSLLVGGFNTFLPTMTLQHSPTTVVTANNSFAPGTIAAFALAGILAFIILSGLLFFFLFYRPKIQRRRNLAESMKGSPKEHEAGVLDIGPETDKMEYNPRTSQPDSARNGFSRWRRGAVEGSPGETSLSIRFRHSDSFEEKNPDPLNEVQLDDLSENASPDSSTRRKARAKSKGKARQITGRSWSPSITIDFPIQRWRRSHRQSVALSPPSAVESLGYVSTFVAAEPSSPKQVAPPSYAVSVSNRDSNPNSNSNPSSHPSSNMPSVPRSVSGFSGEQDRAYPQQNQESAGTFLLHSHSESSVSHSPQRLKPPEAIPMRPLTEDDRGSALEGHLDDNQSVLGPASIQQAIRSLSPRTVRHPYASQDIIQAPPSPQESALQEDDAGLMPLPQTLSNEDQLMEFQDGVFLSVRTPSPFHLSFDISQIKPPSDGSNSGGLSYATASSSAKRSARSSAMSNVVGLGPTHPDATRQPVLMPTGPDFVQGASSTRLRLTPLSIPPTPIVPAHSSNGDSETRTSFLDLTSSREESLASRSMKARWSEERGGGINLYPPIEGKSRWSNTTVPSVKSKSSLNGSSNGSQKIPSEPLPSTLPIPDLQVSLPPSVYNISSDRRSRGTSGLTQTIEHLHVHPAFEGLESPTESIPMSVSEIRFRQSVSEENTGFNFNSRRTTESSLVFVSSHLQQQQQQQQQPQPQPLSTAHDDFMPRPFDPSILVNRVLGLPSPSPTSTARHPIVGSPSVGTTTPSPIPFASRHDTNNRGDRSNSEISGTD